MLISDWISYVCSSDLLLECIAVSASTGVIPAFGNFLTHLDPRIAAPILLTQHLPDAFMEFYARQIGLMTQRRVRVAEAGVAVEPHHNYLAPGHAHRMVVSNSRRRANAPLRRASWEQRGCESV